MTGEAIVDLVVLVRGQADHREKWLDPSLSAQEARHEREMVATMRTRADAALQELRDLVRRRGK